MTPIETLTPEQREKLREIAGAQGDDGSDVELVEHLLGTYDRANALIDALTAENERLRQENAAARLQSSYLCDCHDGRPFIIDYMKLEEEAKAAKEAVAELAALRERLGEVEKALGLAVDEMCRATFKGPPDRKGLNYAIDKARAALTQSKGADDGK